LGFARKKSQWILGRIEKFMRLGPLEQRKKVPGEYKKYREQAQAFILEEIEKINYLYNFKFKFNRVSIKDTQTRWGSCSRKGNLNFNYRIIFLPEELARYIIVHELCHLKELNHSSSFWNLVAIAVPNHKQLRKKLRREVV